MPDLGKFEMLPDEFAPIPDSWYDVEIEKIDTRTSNAGNEYLALQLSVTEGDHSGRKLFPNFNLWHPDPTVVKIAQRSMGNLFKAAGFSTMGETDQLLGQQVRARVLAKPRKDDPETIDNVVRDFRSNGAARPPSKGSPAKQEAPWTNAA